MEESLAALSSQEIPKSGSWHHILAIGRASHLIDRRPRNEVTTHLVILPERGIRSHQREALYFAGSRNTPPER